MKKQVFVGNLAYGVTDDDLRLSFEEKGIEVEESKVVRDLDTGQSRGFGFVTLGSASTVERAIEQMSSVDLRGRQISVEQARGVTKRHAQN